MSKLPLRSRFTVEVGGTTVVEFELDNNRRSRQLLRDRKSFARIDRRINYLQSSVEREHGWTGADQGFAKRPTGHLGDFPDDR